MMRIALGIEYNGNNYYGWQSQTGLPTVQGHLENALTKIADEPIQVFCAGRTDAGVHAIGQVVHFDTQSIRNPRAWTLGVNTHLPPTISVAWMHEVNNEFHARFSALARRYRYIIFNSSTRSATLAGRATWFHHSLDAEKMQKGAQHLLGELNFSSFRSAQCEANTPMRNVHEITVVRHGNIIIIEIQANAFLHHMVRNIVGVLFKIGTGEKHPDWVHDVLIAKNRRTAAETAPASGLYLIKVEYPEKYVIPHPLNLSWGNY